MGSGWLISVTDESQTDTIKTVKRMMLGLVGGIRIALGKKCRVLTEMEKWSINGIFITTKEI